ncbi:hypothetical protein ABZX41_25795, partial [Streptomyces sp. NPDC004533]
PFCEIHTLTTTLTHTWLRSLTRPQGLAVEDPWDIDGAGRAGLSTAWLRRRPDAYPAALRPADREATGIADLARRLDTAPER